MMLYTAASRLQRQPLAIKRCVLHFAFQPQSVLLIARVTEHTAYAANTANGFHLQLLLQMSSIRLARHYHACRLQHA